MPDLSPLHEELLRSSAISEPVARARGYLTVTESWALEQRGFSPAQRRVPGLLIPLHGVAGDVTGYQFRPDKPRLKDGKPIKYETARGSRMRLDVTPSARLILSDLSDELWITEGVRKADAAASVGLTCLALIGVWCWRGKPSDKDKQGSVALADWEHVALKGRRVVLAFDSDVVTKPSVRMALGRLRAFLEARGARVRVCHLRSTPTGEKVGLDDALAAGATAESLRALCTEEMPLPPALPPDAARPKVHIGGDVRAMTDQAEGALVAAEADVYQRDGQLVRLRPREGAIPALEPLPRPTLVEILSSDATWVSRTSGEEKRVPPPREVVDALLARGTWGLRHLETVSDAPMLTAEGEVIESAGYHEEARSFIAPSQAFPPCARAPGIDRARAALAELAEPFALYRFVAESDRSAVLALVLTLAARGPYLDGPSPLFLCRATSAGAGKGKLLDAAACATLGHPVHAITAGLDDAELRKQVTTTVLEGRPVVLLDEARHLSSPLLAQILTIHRWDADRILGASKLVRGVRPVLCSAGPNTTLGGDLARRVLPIDVDPGVERPEASRFPFDPVVMARSQRPRLLVAALDVLAAYARAGHPGQGLEPIGSYERWEQIVRSALVWAGLVDPCLGRERIRAAGDDAGAAALAALLRVVRETWGDERWTVAQLLRLSEREEELGEALEQIAGDKTGRVIPRTVGMRLATLRGRVLGGLLLDRPNDAHGHVAAWRVIASESQVIATTMLHTPPTQDLTGNVDKCHVLALPPVSEGIPPPQTIEPYSLRGLGWTGGIPIRASGARSSIELPTGPLAEGVEDPPSPPTSDYSNGHNVLSVGGVESDWGDHSPQVNGAHLPINPIDPTAPRAVGFSEEVFEW